jgi:hypothetical protein
MLLLELCVEALLSFPEPLDRWPVSIPVFFLVD